MEGDERTSLDPPVPVDATGTDRPQIDQQELPSRARTIPRWTAIVGVLVILGSIGGMAAWGFMSAGELERQTSALASAREELAARQSELAGANASLASIRLIHNEATTRSTSLKDRVADQSACIAAQAAARTAISSITELQIDTFNLTTKDSVWAKAQIAREKALIKAYDDYYDAYKSAFVGNSSAATTSYRKGQADEAAARAQQTIQDAELAKVSASNKKIVAALDAFASTMATATSACATS
jgi:hypothetical protein